MKPLKVLSLFDGVACGRLALERRGIPVERYVAYEIDKYAIQIAKKNWPDIEHCGDVFEADFTQYSDFDLLIGGPPCFTKGHLVLTDKGYKDISEIVVGDMVLTHKGNYKPVIRTNTREAEIWSLKVMGYPEFRTTSEHPFYTLKRRKANNQEYHATHSFRVFSDKPEWVAVKDLNRDYFCGQHILTPAKRENKFEIDNELRWILGRYVADGHLRKSKRKHRKNSYQYRVVLSIGKDKIGNFKQKVQNRKYSCFPHTQSTYRCCFNLQELVEFIEKHFGKGRANKRIPEFIYSLPKDLQETFLDGYMSGDGCYNKMFDSYVCSTVSMELAFGMQRLVTAIYRTNASVSVQQPRTKEHKIGDRVIKSNYPLYTVIFKKGLRKQSVAHEQDNIMWTQVRKAENTKQFDTVYNIEVADDNSYTVNNCIVHNCTYWSLANTTARETTQDGKGGELFMQYVRALRESGIPYFLCENNYSIHKNIKEFISEQLGVQHIMINSALLSAQSRKRCYWTNIPGVTQPEDKGILLKDILENDLPLLTIEGGESNTITASYGKTGDNIFSANGCERAKPRVAIPINTIENGKARTIKAQSSQVSIANISRQDGFGATGVAIPADKPIRVGVIGKGSQGSRIYSVKGKSITLSANGGGGGAKTGLYKVDLPDGDYIVRKLTPVEAERLQTLPDNYTEGISNTQRYKCIGNGWTVDVIRHILKNLHNAERPLEPTDFKQTEQISLF